MDELPKFLALMIAALPLANTYANWRPSKLEALGSRIRELQHLRTALRKTIDDWDQRLAKTPSGSRAALLESLAAAGPSVARQLSPLLAPALRRKFNQRPVSIVTRMADHNLHLCKPARELSSKREFKR